MMLMPETPEQPKKKKIRDPGAAEVTIGAYPALSKQKKKTKKRDS